MGGPRSVCNERNPPFASRRLGAHVEPAEGQLGVCAPSPAVARAPARRCRGAVAGSLPGSWERRVEVVAGTMTAVFPGRPWLGMTRPHHRDAGTSTSAEFSAHHLAHEKDNRVLGVMVEPRAAESLLLLGRLDGGGNPLYSRDRAARPASRRRSAAAAPSPRRSALRGTGRRPCRRPRPRRTALASPRQSARAGRPLARWRPRVAAGLRAARRARPSPPQRPLR
jgi:hypothetical protein